MKKHDCEYGDTGRCVHCRRWAPEILAMERSANWLAKGNALSERGRKKQAERCYEKSAYWLNRYNALIGDA